MRPKRHHGCKHGQNKMVVNQYSGDMYVLCMCVLPFQLQKFNVGFTPKTHRHAVTPGMMLR